MALQTTADIITKFGLYFGDETSLSSVESLDLCQKKYEEILESEEWEFLKKEATGSINGTDLSVPADFNRLTTDQTIYLGSNLSRRQVIPFTIRRDYHNQRGYAYYDARQSKLVFTATENDTYSYDYIFVPPALDLSTSNPVFPTRYYDMVYSAMLLDADIINLSNKARSYASLNKNMYESGLAEMKSWNKKLSAFNTYGV